MNTTKLIRACVLAAGVLMAPAVALCEDASVIPPREESVPWLAILYAVVCVAGVSAVAFKNARRTHLD